MAASKTNPLQKPTKTTSKKTDGPVKFGLALGSGAARGWIHVGVLQALDDLGIKPDVMTGCSAGALVGGASLLGILDEFKQWARSLSPVSALGAFSFQMARGGLINPENAFKAFRDNDRPIEDLPIPFGAVATDLGTGQEVWLTEGSTLDAARASSAIPMLIHAAPWSDADGAHWLVDGALTNPVPVNLARELGATHVLAIDVNPISRTIERFKPSPSHEVVTVDKDAPSKLPDNIPAPVAKLITDTQRFIDRQRNMALQRLHAKPHFFETALATMDIVQAQMGEARAQYQKPDLRLLPDVKGLTPMSFDKHEEMTREGYDLIMNNQDKIIQLVKGQTLADKTMAEG